VRRLRSNLSAERANAESGAAVMSKKAIRLNSFFIKLPFGVRCGR
jgi:hypothetical protein